MKIRLTFLSIPFRLLSSWLRPKKKITQDQTDLILVLDIGTEYMKALVCSVEDGNVVVLGTGKKRQRLTDMQKGTILDVEKVEENAHEVVEEAIQDAQCIPDDLVIGIAGEHIKGKVEHFSYIREDAHAKISPQEMKTIIHKLQWQAFQEVRSELAMETGYSEIEVKLLNTVVVDVRIDGSRVSNPIGFQGRNLEISVFNAFAPLVHYSSLRSIAASLDKHLLSIIVEPYAVSRVLGDATGSDYAAIYLDIGGGTTDVAVVEHGGIVGTSILGIGGRIFSQRIAKSLGISFHEADQLKLEYSRGELGPREAQQVQKIVSGALEVWGSGIYVALKDLTHLTVLPSRIFLCGGGSMLPDIMAYLSKSNWYQDLPFPQAPRVSYITPQDISGVIDTTESLTTQQDVTPLALARIGVELLGEESAMGRMVRQVTRIIAQ